MDFAPGKIRISKVKSTLSSTTNEGNDGATPVRTTYLNGHPNVPVTADPYGNRNLNKKSIMGSDNKPAGLSSQIK